ncbi:PadR family transcriptional regulator [Nocardia arthritidis]|uniref:PadR family transcriptional regulator n=1 Tax=Nocardia arthritidis TaxID=228602 RepID=A0A6G9YPB0_9NOCA|nr:PadR family transcriptional regulator [Nocardia arthritidis]QIS14970.1 PadR family transcriptional regulator [Nocardia arthritidis]
MQSVNSLGLAVLRLLCEQPQHPYEMRQRMGDHGIDVLIKVTRGALYHTFDVLTKAGLIELVETTREGKRPERTVYAITDAGREVAQERVRELLAKPAPEYPSYAVALAFMSLLPKEHALGRLELRCVLLEAELASCTVAYEGLLKRGLPALSVVEWRHKQAHLRADLELTNALIDEIRSGAMEWSLPQDDWKSNR